MKTKQDQAYFHWTKLVSMMKRWYFLVYFWSRKCSSFYL